MDELNEEFDMANVTACTFDDCDREARGNLCNTHFAQFYAWGYCRPIAVRLGWPERFWAKVDQGDRDVCWRWTAALQKHGYGIVYAPARGNSLAHRIAYELTRGPIPEGLVIDHLCRNRACVNPAHLEVVTNHENCIRGISPFAQNKRKTHCINGHPFNEANTRYRTTKWGTVSRSCIACRTAADARRRGKADVQ